MHYPDVMVDIETTGLDPSANAMIQLAAVRFNLKERTIDTASMFDRCLAVPSRRYWDEGTRDWWGQQKRSVLLDIYARMEDPKTVLEDFGKWVGYTPLVPHRFWAKPIHFDYPFVQSYLSQFDVVNPFHFRWCCDLNTYIRGVAQNPDVEQYKTEFKGDAHNALYDVINQIDSLFQASDHFTNLTSESNEDQTAG